MFLAGNFLHRDAVVRAILDLKINGFTPAEIAVYSDEPIEFPHSVLHRPSHMSLAVVIAAITFCLLTVGFVYFTQYDYPIVTGGMPIFSFWATGVVFYEMTMLGAIVIAFFWFLGESGLLRRGPRPPSPPVESGIICIRVKCSSDQADAARRSLESAGAGNVRTLGAIR